MYVRKDTNEAIIFQIIKRESKIKVIDLFLEAEEHNIERKKSRLIVKSLLGSGRIYQPVRGFVEMVEY